MVVVDQSAVLFMQGSAAPNPAPLPSLWAHHEKMVVVDQSDVLFTQGSAAPNPAPLPSLWAHHEKMVVVDQSAVLFTQGSAASRSISASRPMGSPREVGRH
jgi:hypothetical protein